MRLECRRTLQKTSSAEDTALHATDDEAREETRHADEEKAVEAALAPLYDTVVTFLETKAGQLVLKKEVLRVQAMRKSRQRHATKTTKKVDQNASMQKENSLLKDLFASFDLDESNSIDRYEFSVLVQELGLPLSRPAIAMAFDKIDIDQSGHVSYEEFATWVSSSSLSSDTSSVSLMLQQWWTQLWNVQAKKRLCIKEATRYLVAKEKILMERQVRAAFRSTWPPKYTCSSCGHGMVLDVLYTI